MSVLLILPLLGLALMAFGLGSFGVVETGSSNDDILEGSDKNDLVVGYGGNDLLTGGAGNDLLFGGNGNDTLYGNDGNDWLFGERGDDLAFGGAGNDFQSGGPGNDTLYGEVGDDRLVGIAGSNHLYGGDGNDTLSGIDIPQSVFSDAEVFAEFRATLNAVTKGMLAGGDLTALTKLLSQSGPAGQDWLEGGAGDDHLTGDSGDTLTGGEGADTFVVHFNGADDFVPVVVTDFQQADSGISLVIPPESAQLPLDAITDGRDTVLRLGGREVMRLQNVQMADVALEDITREVIAPRDFYRNLLRFAA